MWIIAVLALAGVAGMILSIALFVVAIRMWKDDR